MIDNFSVKLLKNIKISSQKESNIKLIYWLKGSGSNFKFKEISNERKRFIICNVKWYLLDWEWGWSNYR